MDCDRLEMLIVRPCCLKAFSQSSLVMFRGSVKASCTTTVNVSGQKPVSHIITVRDRGEVSCDWLRAEKRRVFSRKVVFFTYEVFDSWSVVAADSIS